jgi:hypothetical protein
MILTAQLLDTFDRGGPRRFAFEREYEPLSISPLGLLYAAVEGSLVAGDPVQGAKDAILERTQRLEVSAGDLSSLSAVRHVESMAEVIALALRAKLGRASMPARGTLGEHEWKSNLFECRGEHHRIILVSHLDDDSLRSFAHSWGTIGELAALEKPITLTVVLIGSQRGGRRHSPWAKGFLHPVQKALRFAPRKKDDGFTQNWKTCWREQTEIKAETWLDRMRTDEMLEELIVSRKIQYRGDDERMRQAKSDILSLAEEMKHASGDAPMRRSACDEIGRGPCPFQAVCYSPTPATPEDFPGLYRPISR